MGPPPRGTSGHRVAAKSGRAGDEGEVLAFDCAGAARVSPSLSLSPRAEVSLCFREGAAALKTPNVTAEYYDLRALCG